MTPIFRTPSAYEFPLLIKQLLITPIARATKNHIVYADRRRYGYPELMRRIARLANVLNQAGLQGGDTVAVMDWDSHRYLECYFAIPMTGRVLQTVNIRLSADQILYTLNHSGAKAVIVHVDFLPLLEGIRDNLTAAQRFIVIDENALMPRTPLPVLGEYEALLADTSSEYEFPDFDENARATIFYTSGTTGMPKGVYYSHRQMVLHALGVLATFGTAPAQGRLHADDVYMPITPLFHAHAWGIPYAATVLGLSQVFPGRYVPETLLDLIAREKVTFSHCVATMLQMMLALPKSREVDLRGVKFLIGGGALPAGLAREALERGIDVFTGYGMSETGPVQVINHLTAEELDADIDRQVLLRTRAGRPVLLCDVRTVGGRLNPLPHDGQSVGEVVFRSPWLTQGYFDNPETSEELWRGGWLHSSDIGVFDADGSLRITDRLKDVIKTGGEWISSLELESLISRHPSVAEVAVIAVPDPKWGERPLALVVPKNNMPVQADAETIRQHVAGFVEEGRIPKYAVPDEIRFVTQLPKTSVGKLDKKLLRAKFR